MFRVDTVQDQRLDERGSRVREDLSSKLPTLLRGFLGKDAGQVAKNEASTPPEQGVAQATQSTPPASTRGDLATPEGPGE